ncbi:MAG: Hpt domain-containing protein [Nitrospirae bacterium]|nr:Hpt domain-containing protein [Nitrospirota bacterium]
MDDEAKYQTFFIDNATEWLTEMESRLCEFEQSPQDKDLLNDIFRTVHNIKGTSNTVGFHTIYAFAHYVEDLLQYLRQDSLVPDKQIINALFSAVDIILDMVESCAGKTVFDLRRCEEWIVDADLIKSHARLSKHG